MGKFRVVSYASSVSLDVCSSCCTLVYDSYMVYPKCVHAYASFYRWSLQTCDHSLEIHMETVSRLRIFKYNFHHKQVCTRMKNKLIQTNFITIIILYYIILHYITLYYIILYYIILLLLLCYLFYDFCYYFCCLYHIYIYI